MKNNYIYIICLFALAGLFSCKGEDKFFSLDGTVKGMPAQTVVLEELGLNETKMIDSTHSDKDGKFSLKGIYTEPALYRIKLNDRAILVVVDGQHVKIRSKWEDVLNFTAEGSPGSSSLAAFMKEYIHSSKELLALEMASDSLNAAEAPDSVMAMIESDLDHKTNDFKKYVRQVADTSKSLPVALYAAMKLINDDAETDYLKTFAAGISKRFSDNQLSSDFKDKIKEKLASQQNTGSGPKIGSIAPDFTLNALDGKPVSLKEFRGKYLLVDFWASWCPPCRAENPNVVLAYERFRNKNFTILGVSLDKDKSKWQEAVTKDRLTWTHVSDLQGWESAVAASYGVQSIPANFLIDPTGKIIAVNLRGDDLEKVLASKLAAEVK